MVRHFSMSLCLYFTLLPLRVVQRYFAWLWADCIPLVIAESESLVPKDKTADGLFPKRVIKKSYYLDYL